MYRVGRPVELLSMSLPGGSIRFDAPYFATSPAIGKRPTG